MQGAFFEGFEKRAGWLKTLGNITGVRQMTTGGKQVARAAKNTTVTKGPGSVNIGSSMGRQGTQGAKQFGIGAAKATGTGLAAYGGYKAVTN